MPNLPINEYRRGEGGSTQAVGVGVPPPAQYESPAGPPGTAARGTGKAVIISVDNATSPRYCTIAVNNKSPFEAGYTLPTGCGPFAAGGTAGYNFFYDNASGLGGSIVNVDFDARQVTSFTGDTSSSAPTPYYKAITDHLHSGNLNPDGYTNPSPVDLSTGQTVNTLPYNQNSPAVQGVISSGGNVIATDFPGQVTKMVTGTYAGYYQDNVSNLFDNHYFAMSPGDWLYMDWSALNVNGSGTINQGWGPMVRDSNGNRILFNNYSNQVALTKYTSGTWTQITSFGSPAPGTNDNTLHQFTMGVQYISGTTFRYQLLVDGVVIADYTDTTSVLTNANLTPGFYQDATNNVYIRTYDYYSQNQQSKSAPPVVTISASGVSLSNYSVGSTTFNVNLSSTFTFTNGATLSNWLSYIDITYTSSSSNTGLYGGGGLLAVRVPASSLTIGTNQVSINCPIALPTGSAWYLHAWICDNNGKYYHATPDPLIQVPSQSFASGALPTMPAGATVSISNLSMTLYDGGMRRLMSGGGSYAAAEYRATFTLNDSNVPDSSKWASQWVAYTRATSSTSVSDKTTYTRSLLMGGGPFGNGTSQTVYFRGLTPGVNYDFAIALMDNQSNETPLIIVAQNYAVPSMGNGGSIGRIIGPGHLYGGTDNSITAPVTLRHIPDDGTSGRYAVANIDNNRRALVDFSQTGHTGQFQTSAWFLAQQSMVPVVSDFTISCTGNNPSTGAKNISYSWGGWTWETADGSTTTYSSGFSSSTTTDYQGNAIVAGSYHVTAAYNWGTSGNVTTWFTNGPISLSYGVQFMGNGKMTLVVNQGPITVPSTAGTSGSTYTPPAPQCPAAHQLIETLERGLVPAGTIKPGEHVYGFKRWVKVKRNSIGRSEILRIIIDNRAYDVEKTHLWLTEIGWWPSNWLERGDRLINFNQKKPWIYIRRIHSLGIMDYAKLEVEGHILRFKSDDPAVGHNVNYQTQ